MFPEKGKNRHRTGDRAGNTDNQRQEVLWLQVQPDLDGSTRENRDQRHRRTTNHDRKRQYFLGIGPGKDRRLSARLHRNRLRAKSQ